MEFIISANKKIKKYFSIPLSTRTIRISNEDGLNSNIVTTHNRYEDKTVIKCYTETESNFLKQIK